MHVQVRALTSFMPFHPADADALASDKQKAGLWVLKSEVWKGGREQGQKWDEDCERIGTQGWQVCLDVSVGFVMVHIFMQLCKVTDKSSGSPTDISTLPKVGLLRRFVTTLTSGKNAELKAALAKDTTTCTYEARQVCLGQYCPTSNVIYLAGEMLPSVHVTCSAQTSHLMSWTCTLHV